MAAAPESSTSTSTAAGTAAPAPGPGGFVYILLCADGSFYVGVTNDLKRRVHQHAKTKAGARHARSRRPIRLAAALPLPTYRQAMGVEKKIKALSTKKKVEAALLWRTSYVSTFQLVPEEHRLLSTVPLEARSNGQGPRYAVAAEAEAEASKES
jgi:putative endonuclease